MVGPETEIVQQHKPQSIPKVAEIDRLGIPTETILPILPLVARLESSLSVASTNIYASANLEVGHHRLSRGRRGSRGLSRRHSSRRCGVCEVCRGSSRGLSIRNRCRSWMAGGYLTILDK